LAGYRSPFTRPLLVSLLVAALLLAACHGASETPHTSPTPTIAASPTATIAASPTPTATASPTPTPTVTGGSASLVSGQEAYRHVIVLAQDIGSRPAGSDAEFAAADYIADQFTSYGYRAVVEPFELEYYVEQASRLEVHSPETITLEPQALRLSASGEATGDLAAAGIGRPEDFPPEGMTSQIALVERGELTFSDKVANAATAGAAAVIVYNNEEGPFRGDLEEESAIPAVGISQEDGQRLLGLLAQGPVSVDLSVEPGLRKVTSRNVVVRPPDGRCERLVGAHYDSVEAGPGANDNASGVGVLLETARALALGGDREGVCLVAFGAEEVGLVGSHHFVADLSPDERQALEGMINLDMVGVGDQWQLIGSEELVTEVDSEAASLGLDPVPAELPSGLGADQNSFIGAGIPAILIYRSEDPRYHSAEDQAQFVEPQALEEATELTLLALRLLAEP
jgi:aminopeptidase YwaD